MKFRALALALFVASASLLLCLLSPTYAQTAQVDSLKNLLSQKLPDTTRAIVLERLGSALMYSEPLEAMKFVREGLTTAERAKYPVGVVRNLNRLGSIYRNVGSYAKALESHLNALRVARKNDDLEGMARVNNSIGILYSEQKDSQRAVAYFTKTKDLAQQIGNDELLEISLTNLSSDYARIGPLDSAQAYAFRAYDLAV